MCNYPYSNRDLFEYVSSCHIHLEVFTALVIIHILVTGLIGFIGLYESYYRKRKDVAIAATLYGLFFAAGYIWLLLGNITFASKNYGLNFIHGLARGMIWIQSTYLSFRNVEVLLSVDKKMILPNNLHPQFYRQFLKIFPFCIALPIELCILIFPIAFPLIFPMVNTVSIGTMIITLLHSPLQFLYMNTLRKLVLSMKKKTPHQSNSYYDEIDLKFKQALRAGFFSVFMGILVNLLWMFVHVMHENMYIAYNIQFLLGHMAAGQTLYMTSGDRQKIRNSKNSSSHQSTDHSHHSHPNNPNHNPPRKMTTRKNSSDQSPAKSQSLNDIESDPDLNKSSSILPLNRQRSASSQEKGRESPDSSLSPSNSSTPQLDPLEVGSRSSPSLLPAEASTVRSKSLPFLFNPFLEGVHEDNREPQEEEVPLQPVQQQLSIPEQEQPAQVAESGAFISPNIEMSPV